MTTRPVLFSAPMVLALLAERKGQTRRILRTQPDAVETHHFLSGPCAGKPYEIIRCYNPPARLKPCNSGWSVHCPGPFRFLGDIGDQLWVKETWRTSRSLDHCKPIHLREGAPIQYEADTRTNINNHERGPLSDPGRIRQSIFMRRWMARIFLTIEDIRVQRLQDITEQDAIAEGMQPSLQLPDGSWMVAGPARGGTYREGFRYLWGKIHGPTSWDENPYVSVTTFTTTFAPFAKP